MVVTSNYSAVMKHLYLHRWIVRAFIISAVQQRRIPEKCEACLTPITEQRHVPEKCEAHGTQVIWSVKLTPNAVVYCEIVFSGCRLMYANGHSCCPG